ncbi:MAG: hypothetical protein MI747_15245 [Desulfobacterales bacterium]|nr:hypothetical protein [Desulfobacterales bacterium]
MVHGENLEVHGYPCPGLARHCPVGTPAHLWAGHPLVFQTRELGLISRGNGTHPEILAEPSHVGLSDFYTPRGQRFNGRGHALIRVGVEPVTGRRRSNSPMPAPRKFSLPWIEITGNWFCSENTGFEITGTGAYIHRLFLARSTGAGI